MDNKDFDKSFLKHLGIEKEGRKDDTDFSSEVDNYLGSLEKIEKDRMPRGQKLIKAVNKNFRNIMPERTVDLHQLTRKEAETVLLAEIKKAQAKNQKTMLVITGKGIHSPDGPVIRDFARDLLNEHENVSTVKQAPRRLGGSGAMVVFLK